MNVPVIREFIINYSLVILAIILIANIIVRIQELKNKKKKLHRKRISYNFKFDIYEFLTADIKEEYIGQKKMIIQELRNL